MPAWLSQLGAVWWTDLVINTSRYAAFSLSTWALLWVALKAPLSGRKIRAESPSWRQMTAEFLFSLRSVAVFATSAVIMIYLARAGGYPMSHPAARWGPLWFGTSLVLMILGHDAYYYWTHRAMHLPAIFRRTHARHHLSLNPSPFTAYSFDVREAALMVSFVVLWPLVVPTPWPVVPLFILHQIVRNTLLHAGYELAPARADGRPLFDFLTTATHHDLHHAESRSNFGLYFTWWDRWMGTENPSYHAAFARAVRKGPSAEAGPATA